MIRDKISDEDLKNIKKILIIQTAFIGDVILITPLIKEIKSIFPDSEVDVILTSETSGLFLNNSNINQVLIFDKRNNKIISFFKVLKYMLKREYNIAFLPHSSVTTAILAYISKIPIRIGFGRWIARYLLTHKVYNIGNLHKIEKNLRLLTPLTSKKFPIQTELFPNSEMIKKADKLLDESFNSVDKVVAIAPGSNWFTKRWPKEYYKDLVHKLVKQGYGIAFIGSHQERELSNEIDPKFNSINLTGKLSMLESAAVIKRCDLMICNDSGALHIANAMQTDVMAFFGPTVKEIGYYPIREDDIVMEVDLDCRPCSTHGENVCKLGHHNCMKLITPEIVLRKIIQKFTN